MVAEGERDTANDEKDAANTALMVAEGERDAANEERDAAITTALAAVERAALLEKVNPFSVKTEEGYNNVTVGIREIPPGENNTAPGDDITFSCPEGGEHCVVVVAKDEDDVASYTVSRRRGDGSKFCVSNRTR